MSRTSLPRMCPTCRQFCSNLRCSECRTSDFIFSRLLEHTAVFHDDSVKYENLSCAVSRTGQIYMLCNVIFLFFSSAAFCVSAVHSAICRPSEKHDEKNTTSHLMLFPQFVEMIIKNRHQR